MRSLEGLHDDMVLVERGRVEGLVRAFTGLIDDDARREEPARVGPAAVAHLTWRSAAEATARIYLTLGVPVTLASHDPEVHQAKHDLRPDGPGARSHRER